MIKLQLMLPMQLTSIRLVLNVHDYTHENRVEEYGLKRCGDRQWYDQKHRWRYSISRANHYEQCP